MLLLKSFYIIFQYIIAQNCQKSKDQNIKKLLMHCIYSVGLSPGAARLSFYDVIAILVIPKHNTEALHDMYLD